MAKQDPARPAPPVWLTVTRQLDAKRIAVTLGALIVYRLGLLIPVPGIDVEAAGFFSAAQSPIGFDTLARVSVFALGIGPLFSMLILAQVLKLAAPGLDAWTRDEPGFSNGFSRGLAATALALSAFQGYGIALALEAMNGAGGLSLVPEPGSAFRTGVIISLVAGTAVVIWLAGLITRHGVGSGFWIMLLAPEVANLAHFPAAVLEFHGRGDVSTKQILLLGLCVAAAVAALVAIARMVTAEMSKDGAVLRRPLRFLAEVVVWPPIIALVFAGYAAALFAAIRSWRGIGDSGPPLFAFANPSHLLLVAVLIAFLTFAFAHLVREHRTSALAVAAQGRDASVRWAAMCALVTIAIVVAMEMFLKEAFPAFLEGGWLIAIVLTCLAILPGNAAALFPDQEPLQPPSEDA
jgi:preprotein translocase subunit SecY